MAIDKEAIKEHVRGILIALGDDPDREGLVETPDRVARMYEEVFEGMNYTNDELAEMFGKTFAEDGVARQAGDMVFVKDIEVFSYCEHHMALIPLSPSTFTDGAIKDNGLTGERRNQPTTIWCNE